MTLYNTLYLSIRYFRPQTPSAYLLAAILVALATALRVAMGPIVPGVQFITLFPAVLATTLICGMAAGFFSVALAALGAWYFILPKAFSFASSGIEQFYVLLSFVVIASGIVTIIGAMRAASHHVGQFNQTLATMFEANPDAILLTDAHGRITKVNQHAAVLFGISRDALVGTPLSNLIPERYREGHAALHASYRTDPRPREMGAGLDLFARRGDGTEFPVDIQIGPIEIEGARLTIATVRDLTERKVLYRELAESRQQTAIFEARQAGYRALHTALESTTDSVVVLDRAWCFSYLNEHATACLGHGRDLRGQMIWDTFPGLTDSNIGAALRTAVEADAPASAHGCFIESGTHFEAHAYPSPDGLTIFLRDVTQERNGAALLAQSEALLRLFIERAPAAIAIFDTEMRYLAASQRFALDYRINSDCSDTLIGRSHYEVFPEIPEHWRAIHRRVLNGEILSADEDPFPRAGGGTDWIRWEMTPWRHADGTIGGAMLFSQIVTEQRAAERALRELTENLAARLYENEDLMACLREEVGAREAAQMRAAHAERLQALGQLAGGIAHDFNNVLQLIKGVATLIEQQSNDDGVGRLARLAMKATRRGGAITRRLLAFSRRGDLRAERLDVATMLNDLREIFVHTLGVNIKVDIGLEDGLSPVFADKAQLETVLINLATNARDAMPEGGRLTLSATTEIVPPEPASNPASLAPGRYVRLTVADTGTGMDADTLARAQEPFFTTKGSGAGTGLGLPMARSFTEQSGGALHVESSPGHGTTITLWFPEDGADRSVAPVTTRDAPEAAISETRTPSRPARVLLVDDEDELREVLAQNLEERGYNVLAAMSSREALALLAAGEAVDILVTDLSMPHMDGIALIQRAQQQRPGLPAVLLTGYVGDGVAVATDEAIADAYSLARKPIGTDDLIDLIEALLATKTPPARARARARDHPADAT